MASVGDIKAGRAYVELGTRDSALVAGLNSAAQRLQRFGAAIRGIGLQFAVPAAAVFAPLVAASQTYAEVGDKLAKASTRTGASVESLSTLGYAAKQSGADLESLETGIKKMSKTLVEAAQGSAPAIDALREVGLTVADLAKLSPDERFKKIADGLSRIQDPAVKSTAAMEIFGKGAIALLPLMQDGARGIELLQQRARDLGLEWSTRDAKAAEEFGDRLDDLWQVLKNGVAVIGGAVAPVLRTMAILTMNAAIAATAWVREHKQLVTTAFLASAALLAAGTSLVVLGTAFSAVGIAVGTLGSVLGIVKLALTPIGILAGGAAKAMTLLGAAGSSVVPLLGAIGKATLFILNPFKLIPAIAGVAAGAISAVFGVLATAAGAVVTAVAAILSPVVLVGAAVVGLAAYFLYTSGIAGKVFTYLQTAGGAVVKYLTGVFQTLKSDVTAAFGGIRDALSAGDWRTAAQILWTTIKLEFSRGMQGLWDPLVSSFYKVKAILADGWGNLIASVEKIWSYMQEYLSNWDGVKTAAEAFWEWYKNKASAVIRWVSDQAATIIIKAQVEDEIRTKYGGKQLTAKDAEMLGAPVAEAHGSNLRAWAKKQGNIDPDSLNEAVSGDQAAIIAKYKQLYSAGMLTEAQIQDLINDRVAAASEDRQRDNPQDANVDELYNARMKNINDAYAAKQPNAAAVGNADRAKIDDEKNANLAADEKKLKDALASIDPKRTDEIAALQKELTSLREKAATEAKASKDKNAQADAIAGEVPELPEGVSGLSGNDLSALTKEVAKTSSVGAFNTGGKNLTNEIFGSGESTIAERTAKATEQTAKNTDPRNKQPVPSSGVTSTPPAPAPKSPVQSVAKAPIPSWAQRHKDEQAAIAANAKAPLPRGSNQPHGTALAKSQVPSSITPELHRKYEADRTHKPGKYGYEAGVELTDTKALADGNVAIKTNTGGISGALPPDLAKNLRAAQDSRYGGLNGPEQQQLLKDPAGFTPHDASITPEMHEAYRKRNGQPDVTPFGDIIRTMMAGVRNALGAPKAAQLANLLPAINASAAPILGPTITASLQTLFGKPVADAATKELVRIATEGNRLLKTISKKRGLVAT